MLTLLVYGPHFANHGFREPKGLSHFPPFEGVLRNLRCSFAGQAGPFCSWISQADTWSCTSGDSLAGSTLDSKHTAFQRTEEGCQEGKEPIALYPHPHVWTQYGPEV